MGFFDRFRRAEPEQQTPSFDPLADLVLEKLRVGYLVDYDLKTWKVTDHNRYRFNDGRRAEEWELTEGREKIYLEWATGDGEFWSLSRPLPIGALGTARSHLLEHEDPPEQIQHDGKTYFLDGSVGGEMTSHAGTSHELITWEMVDETEEFFLSIQQWGDTEITAAIGHSVEDYQFSNILPGEP